MPSPSAAWLSGRSRNVRIDYTNTQDQRPTMPLFLMSQRRPGASSFHHERSTLFVIYVVVSPDTTLSSGMVHSFLDLLLPENHSTVID